MQRIQQRLTRLAILSFGAIGILAGGSAMAEPASDTFPAELRISAVGDIMLDGTARPEMQRNGYDYAFAGTRDLLRQSHVVIGNLEGPLTHRGNKEADKQYIFRSPPTEVARALQSAGFDVVSLANNHSLDYGVEGMEDTIDSLAGVGILHMGAGNNSREARAPVFVPVGNQMVAFLAYSLTFPESYWATTKRPGTAFGHEAHIVADVKTAREFADVVVVSFHWGQESKIELREYQTRLGRAAIDAGAQAVVGHHPHILQGVERYKGGVILYSLGNYTFGSFSQKARVSAIAHLHFTGSRLSKVRLHPINVLNVDVLFQPQPLNGKAADDVVATLQQLASKQGTALRNVNGVAELDMAATVTTAQAEDESRASQ
jgi:poly-gamma-glutamate capsule biosynthesis protein CapA/YwtB (metallophosphatase superfamily)